VIVLHFTEATENIYDVPNALIRKLTEHTIGKILENYRLMGIVTIFVFGSVTLKNKVSIRFRSFAMEELFLVPQRTFFYYKKPFVVTPWMLNILHGTIDANK